jgi:hypothetical protein
MRRTLKTTIGYAVILCACSGTVIADNHAQDAPAAFPVEILTCTFNSGKGHSDLDRVNARYNKWADENDRSGYNAWTLTRQFYNSNQEFDLIWLGAWDNFEVMGQSQDSWVGKGGSIGSDYQKVMSCDIHMLQRAYTVMPLAEETPPETGIVMFSTCSATEGAKPRAVYDAHVKWEQWVREKGHNTAAWAFVPDLGAGEIEFDYYLVRSFPNYTEMGKMGEMLFNGGGEQVAQDTLAGVTSCDEPRVYDSRLVRSGTRMQ